jgi:hypothetical protein
MRTVEFNGKPPIVKISQMDITMYPRRNSCISLCAVSHRSQSSSAVIHTSAPRQPSSVAISIAGTR